MHRIDNATSAVTMPVPQVVGPNPNGYFQNATIVDADWLNAVQEEITSVILAQGIALAKTSTNQLNAAIDNKIANASQAMLETDTVALFVQSAAPTGWQQNVTYNDRVIRVVSGAGGGEVGGSWTLSGITVDGHALTVNQMPAHNHGGGNHNHSSIVISTYENRFVSWDNQQFIQVKSISNTTANSGVIITTEGGGQVHNHGLTFGDSWRPAYVDVIACTRL